MVFVLDVYKISVAVFVLILGGCDHCRSSSKNDHPVAPIEREQEIPQETDGSDSVSAHTILQESQQLAGDLSAATSFQSKYQLLKSQISVQPGNNQDPTFVGIEGVKKALRSLPGLGNGNLEKFVSWAQSGDWKQFGPSYHYYDWWMFPIDRSSQGQGWKYTVYQKQEFRS